MAKWFGKGVVEPVTFAISPAQPTVLKLPPGRWVLQAEAPGYWSKGYQLELKGQGALVSLDLWPAGTIEGGFTLQDGIAAPAELIASFRPAPEVPAAQAFLPSQVVCPIEKQTWRCSVPAGVMDLRMQASGFIPRYLWGARVESGGTLRPGRLDLRRGSAVLGWVVTADGTKLGTGAEVSLRPRGGQGIHGQSQQKRLEELTFKTPVNSRGFFQMDGVPPGAYILEARHERFAPSITSVKVVPGEVTEIANPPLLLELPKVVELYVDPATDPLGQPWSVKLQKLDHDSSRLTPVADGTVALDGSWKKPGIPPGRYLLRIGLKSGETWWLDQIEVNETSAPVQVRLDLLDVKGSVQLGDKPLPSKLSFGGRFGAVRIEALADDKGKFKALLPKAGEWMVHVESEDPPVQREFPKLRIEPRPGTHKADLDLQLPDTALRGRVIDEKGEPIPKAIVTALAYGAVREDEVQSRTDDTGHFEFRGLLPGATLVEADAGQDRFADPVTVSIPREEKDSPSVVLTARPKLRVAGTVVSSAGPVAGARVKAAPAGMPYIGIRTVTSDVQGRFEVALPFAAKEMLLTVSAPGFAFRMLRLPVPESRQFTVGVDQVAGTLVVERNETLDVQDPNAPMIYLLGNGSSEALPHLLGWARTAGTLNQDSKRSVIPAVEPGEYQACWVLPAEHDALDFGITPQGRCVSGVLAPNGELSLKLPAMRPEGATR